MGYCLITESVRGETFVTRKLLLLCKLRKVNKKIISWNLDAKRDWGHAKIMLRRGKCYREINLMLCYCGQTIFCKTFINLTLNYLGIKFYWKERVLIQNALIIVISVLLNVKIL